MEATNETEDANDADEDADADNGRVDENAGNTNIEVDADRDVGDTCTDADGKCVIFRRLVTSYAYMVVYLLRAQHLLYFYGAT